MAHFRLLLSVSIVLLALHFTNAIMDGETGISPSNEEVQDYGYFVNAPSWLESGYVGRPKRFFPKIHLPLALRSSFDYAYSSLGHVPSSVASSSSSKAEVIAPARPSFRGNTPYQLEDIQDGSTGSGRIGSNDPVHLRFG